MFQGGHVTARGPGGNDHLHDGCTWLWLSMQSCILSEAYGMIPTYKGGGGGDTQGTQHVQLPTVAPGPMRPILVFFLSSFRNPSHRLPIANSATLT